MTYDENLAAAEARLKPLLTDEFMATLLLAARTVGWSIDFLEAHSLYNCLRYIRGETEGVRFEPIDFLEGSE